MTEKSKQEIIAAQRQTELLCGALERAKNNGGILLNQSGKLEPSLYPKGTDVSAFNAIMLALHSDSSGYKTNQYVLFSEAKKRGESVQTGQKGVPFLWYSWNEYSSKADPEKKISREEYKALSDEQKSQWKPVRQREIRTLFNIDQTTLPMVDKEAYEKAVSDYGTAEDRGITEKDDKNFRMRVNQFLQAVSQNLVPIRKDGTGIAHYDTSKDIIHLPAQKHFATYAEYVQEAVRKIATATGHPLRIGRSGVEMEKGNTPSDNMIQREKLVNELTSAVTLNRMGLPARIAPENIQHIEAWQKAIRENPSLLDGLEAEVNNSISMIARAESGEKIEKSPTLEPIETQSDTISAKVVMLRDDDNQWALYIKPENEKGFAVHPDKEDINRFFVTTKQGDDLLTERVRQDLAQKYYSITNSFPERKIDLFSSNAAPEDLALIQKVNIFKTKGEDSKILCLPTIDGLDSVKPRTVSSSQWQRMWIAEDKNEYKQHLAATLFADVIKQQKEKQMAEAKKQEEEKRKNSPEQKAKEEREEKAKEELTKAETKVIAGIVLSPILRQFNDIKSKHPDALLLFRSGDFYQTYKEDARKASNILGITLTKSSKVQDETGKPLEMAGFPYHALDTYLPKLIRAGERVAICDQLELNKRLAEQESVKPKVEQKQEVERHGYHR